MKWTEKEYVNLSESERQLLVLLCNYMVIYSYIYNKFMNLIIELSAIKNVSEIYFNYCSSNLTAHGNVEEIGRAHV